MSHEKKKKLIEVLIDIHRLPRDEGSGYVSVEPRNSMPTLLTIHLKKPQSAYSCYHFVRHWLQTDSCTSRRQQRTDIHGKSLCVLQILEGFDGRKRNALRIVGIRRVSHVYSWCFWAERSGREGQEWTAQSRDPLSGLWKCSRQQWWASSFVSAEKNLWAGSGHRRRCWGDFLSPFFSMTTWQSIEQSGTSRRLEGYSAFRQKFPKLWTSVAHSFFQQIAQNKNWAHPKATTLPRICKVEMQQASLLYYSAKPQSGGIFGCALVCPTSLYVRTIRFPTFCRSLPSVEAYSQYRAWSSCRRSADVPRADHDRVGSSPWQGGFKERVYCACLPFICLIFSTCKYAATAFNFKHKKTINVTDLSWPKTFRYRL